jgi:hypothetical protein
VGEAKDAGCYSTQDDRIDSKGSNDDNSGDRYSVIGQISGDDTK